MSVWPHIAFAMVLALSAGAGVLLAGRARADARFYMQFAASLYVALAIANALAAFDGGVMSSFFAGGLSLFAAALGPPAMVLGIASARFRPAGAVLATLTLLAALAAALAAAATAAPALAFVPLFAAVCAMAVMASRLWRRARRAAINLIVSACALMAGAAAYMSGGMAGRTAMGLFAAAALLGVAIVLGERSHKRIETAHGLTLRNRFLIRRGR